MRHNGQRRPEEIEADIERTRGELDQTLSAIERRLSPGELVDQGLDYLRHSGAREYVSNLGQAAKRDPIPLALVGVGLAWLAMSSRRDGAAADAAALDEGSTGVRQKLSATTQRLAQGAHAARERARSGAQRVDSIVHEHPLVLGALGLALGAVMGATVEGGRRDGATGGDGVDRSPTRADGAGDRHSQAVDPTVSSSGPAVTPQPG